MARRKRYRAELKREAIRLATEEVVTDVSVAEELPINARQLRSWRGAPRSDGEDAFPGQGKVRNEELMRLKRKLSPVILKYSMPDGSLAVEMIRLPGSTFIRVDVARELVSEVEVSEFTMGRYAVTFEQYDRFAKATGRKLPGACGWGRRSRPIMKVSWFDATAYAQWLSDVTGEDFRLPTEAEWEHACRAGTKTDYSFGENITKEQANFNRTNGKTMPVGSYQPNPFGLYEMHGNVWEWCSDWYDKYPRGKVKDPKGPDKGKYRVLRGGSWFVNAGLTRSTSRACDEPGERDHSRGFRLAGG